MRTLLALVAAVLALPLLTPSAHAFPSPVSGSYYHHKFEGRTMACGGRFDNERLTAASNHHPCGSKVRVSYRDRSVVVRITDRCGRCGIDLTRAAARDLGMLYVGRAPVKVERLTGGDGVEEATYAAPELDEAVYVPAPGDAEPFTAFEGRVIAVAADAPPSPAAVAIEPAAVAEPLHVGAVPTGAIAVHAGQN